MAMITPAFHAGDGTFENVRDVHLLTYVRMFDNSAARVKRLVAAGLIDSESGYALASDLAGLALDAYCRLAYRLTPDDRHTKIVGKLPNRDEWQRPVEEFLRF